MSDPHNIPPIITEALQVIQQTLSPDANIFDRVEVVVYRTEADIRVINEARDTVICEFFQHQSKEYKVLHELKIGSPEEKTLYKQIVAVLKQHVHSEHHNFVYRTVSELLLKLRNCPLHAEQNVARFFTALLVMGVFQVDTLHGQKKPMEDENSRTQQLGRHEN